MPPPADPAAPRREPRLSRRRHTADRGSVTLFWLIAGVAIIGMLGLLVDGGGILRAKATADDIAAEAARTAGQQLDLSQAIPGTALVVDPDAAQQAAEAFLAQAGAEGSVTVSGDGTHITVTVTDTYDAVLTSVVGYTDIPVSGRSTAQLVRQMEG
ncbi:pilus assembly protein TadG-related protein [Streptomyces arboris]|uniref:pilus assembly protein TadG-related protein n=1 Tax=Streptomyces arboris TaxID=2600619 RepID=UPI003628631E